jgi:RNA polymerase sigma-70 factor (ECF subfamily)
MTQQRLNLFSTVCVDGWMGPAADEPEHDLQSVLHVVGDSDGELLCRIADGDLEAFELLYRRYARPVYGLALRRLRDRDGAEHATRRAFAAIRRTAATYAPEHGSSADWLFAVAQNAIELAAREPAPPSTDEEGWPAFRVQAAMAELPEQERLALELACWAGRSQSEIAELLGLPLGTVKIRTRSALARLAMRLDA